MVLHRIIIDNGFKYNFKESNISRFSYEQPNKRFILPLNNIHTKT